MYLLYIYIMYFWNRSWTPSLWALQTSGPGKQSTSGQQRTPSLTARHRAGSCWKRWSACLCRSLTGGRLAPLAGMSTALQPETYPWRRATPTKPRSARTAMTTSRAPHLQSLRVHRHLKPLLGPQQMNENAQQTSMYAKFIQHCTHRASNLGNSGANVPRFLLRPTLARADACAGRKNQVTALAAAGLGCLSLLLLACLDRGGICYLNPLIICSRPNLIDLYWFWLWQERRSCL